MIILALDLGKFNTMCCIYNSKTRKHEFINATTERTYLTTLLKKTKCDLVVMEACRISFPLTHPFTLNIDEPIRGSSADHNEP